MFELGGGVYLILYSYFLIVSNTNGLKGGFQHGGGGCCILRI